MKNELTIFDQIQDKGLRPWLPKNKPDEKFAPKISEIKTELPGIQFRNEIEFYRPFNSKTKYYRKLLLNEVVKYCNHVIPMILNTDDFREQKYLLNDTLDKKLKTRLKAIGVLIKEHQFDTSYIDPKKASFDIDTDHKTDTYIIQLLKTCYIAIFLEIQEVFIDMREDIMILEDFFSQLTFEPIPDNPFLKESPQIIKGSSKTLIKKKLSFGYKESSTQKLIDICRFLNLKIDFLNDELTSENDFIEVMTSKDLSAITKQIHIGCETTQFRYIIDKLKPYFSTLKLSSIEKSKLFYSKNNVLITATNLSRNKNQSPKEKESIDSIFKQLQ